jgi:hypothetical protein
MISLQHIHTYSFFFLQILFEELILTFTSASKVIHSIYRLHFADLQFEFQWLFGWSRDSSAGTVTGYGLDDLGLVPGSARFFSSPECPDQSCGPSSLLSNGYRVLYPRGYSGRGVKLTTHLHLVPRSRKLQRNFHSPIRLHGIAIN